MDGTEQGTPTPLLQFEGYLAEVTVELFDAYGMSLEHQGTEATWASVDGTRVTATLGFVGDKVRGAVVLLTTREAVCHWRDRLSPDPPVGDVVSDTIGEFVNMLVGRLKYRLLLRGVTLLVATPITAIGNHLSLPAPRTGASRWLRFEGEAGSIVARVDATFDADFEFADVALTTSPASAGDMMLF